MQLNRVVLPAPLGPIRPQMLPCSTSKPTASKAVMPKPKARPHRHNAASFNTTGPPRGSRPPGQGLGLLLSVALGNSGEALKVAVSDGASRHGRVSGRGYGIGQLFRALAHDAADLRFRSGDHALRLWGDAPSLSGHFEVAQKAWLDGMIITIRCAPPRDGGAQARRGLHTQLMG